MELPPAKKSKIDNHIENPKNGSYSIMASGRIYSNEKFNVAVSVYQPIEISQFKIGIKGENSFELYKTVDVKGMSTEILEFDVPVLKKGTYCLTAEGLSGIVFDEETKNMFFYDNSPMILIQTDKATYKPGDEINFRVLFLDKNTRPAKIDKEINIIIQDAEKNRLKCWKNIELKKGVYAGKYQLSEQPVLGSWYVKVCEGESWWNSKSFQVKKYILPKFSAIIEAAKDVALYDDVINVTIRAKYTYGKPVKGKAVVSIRTQFSRIKAQKTINIDGEGKTSFKFGQYIHLDPGCSRDLPCIVISAVIEEELTGNKQAASEVAIKIHKYRHCFEAIHVPRDFKPNKKVTLKVSVKTVNGLPVIDSQNRVKLYIKRYDSVVRVLESHLDVHGIATFEFTFGKNCRDYYHLECEFLETKGHLSELLRKYIPQPKKTCHLLKVTVLTQNPKLTEFVEVEIKSCEKIPYFVYSIVSKGSLLKSKMVQMPLYRHSHIMKFLPTLDMFPEAVVVVHFVVNKELQCECAKIKFQNQLLNKIDISMPTEAQPGQEIAININSEPDSYVGLLAVDQSVLLLGEGNDFIQGTIFPSFHRYDGFFDGIYDDYFGGISGLIILTDAIFYSRRERPKGVRGGGGPVSLNIRKDFPETWIFEDIESLGADNLVLKKKVPDTITSWVLTGFAVHPELGFASTENPTIVKTFRPFFIEMNLPYSIKRGEEFSLPVILFNYMENDLEADVTLDNTDQEFDFVHTKKGSKKKRTQRITITANNGVTVNFGIRPKKIGNITLKITAISPIAGDAVHKELKVEPEGITVYKNRDFYMQAEAGALVDVTNEIDLKIPQKIVANSEFIQVTAMGNILGSTITNIDKLVRMPYGCGEQNMVNFVPNILVLWYLESIDELSSAIEEKAKRFLEIGYQRELTYKHKDGSYSAFGKSDACGSTWLTAYVIRSFHQAKKYIDIDSKILEAGLEFLANKQEADGSFVEKGRLFDFSHLNTMGLTSFVLLAFLENAEFADKYKENIERGFEYLQQNIRKCDDLYALAVTGFALQQRKLESVHELLAKLETFSRIDGGFKWWSKTKSTKTKDPFWRARSQDVEITSYILMTLLDMNVSALPITRWLISQRNNNGGFNSSQETVVGLWALIKFAGKIGAAKPDMSIEVTSDKGDEGKHFQITKENSLVVQSVQLSKQTRQVSFTGKGSGTAVLQVAYQYNVSEKEVKSSFKLRTMVKGKSSVKLNFDVFTEFSPEPVEQGQSQVDTSNMAVLEVALPSGYVAVPDSFNKIKEVECVKRVETKNQNTSVVVYFDNLKASDEKRIPIEAELIYDVRGQKPVPVVIYDYYDDMKRASDFYEI